MRCQVAKGFVLKVGQLALQWGMCLEIVAKFLGNSGDQECICKLLNFQVSGFGSHKNLVDIIHQYLDFICFSDKYCAYGCG